MALHFGNLSIVAERILGMLHHSGDLQEIGSLWGVEDELRKLESTISALAPLLLSAEKKGPLVVQFGETLDEAVNLLEDLETGANYLRRGNIMPKKVHSSFSNPLFSRLNMRQKIIHINRILSEAEAQGRRFGLEERRDNKRIQFPNGVEEAVSFIVQGAGASVTTTNSWDRVAKMEIINILLDMKFEQNVTVLPLLLDSTSTMLPWDVFNDERVRKHFHRRIWLSDSESSRTATHALRIIAKHAAGLGSSESSDMDELIKLLSSSLSGVRYLIVFNTTLRGDSKYWLFLRDLIGIGDEGSKIIVTTNKENLTISITGTIQRYRLGCPSENELWSIFENVAFGQHPKNSSLIDVGNNILRMLVSGKTRLPFVIGAIGSMLYFENSEAGWQFYYKNELFRIVRIAGRLPFKFPDVYNMGIDLNVEMRLLESCYDHLPLPLKHCFAYCSLFPKNHEIDVQTTIKLWMAQGFIIDEPGKSLEDVGYEYFLNLLRRFFFQEPKIDVRRRVMKCKMHHLMHDLATSVAGEQCFLFSPDAFRQYRDDSSHVSFGSGLHLAKVATKFTSRNMRSFLLQSQLWDKGHGNYEICNAIASKYNRLCALDTRATGIKTVPYSIGELKFLKYLDLSENGDITKLPDSITNLPKLQTLKLSSCFRLGQLPRGIQNLVNLRHLEIDGCYNLTSLPRGFGQLTNLRTLSHIVLSDGSKMHDVELDAVKGLINLIGEFQIKNLKHEKDVTAYVNVVPCGVRSLSLEWDSHAPKSYYNETSPEDGKLFQDLEELTIIGFSGVTLFSPSINSKLVKVSLRRCANCRILPSLDQLSHLKVLLLDEMVNLEYISNKDSSSASATFFPCLQELWLTELPELQGWWKNGVNELISFPCLSKLVIEDCPNLASMPLFPTLEEGLVLDTTRWKPFQLTMEQKTTAAYDEASSSTSPPPSAPLSKLKNLCIVGIKDCKVEEIKWETLKSLRFLRFDCLPQLTTLPEGLQRVTSLQELHVWRCGIEEIPHWISKLVLLKKLGIRVCSNLKSLPKEIRSLRSLQTLEIEDCNTLLKRCEKEIGADWKRIASIPYKRLGPISGR